MRHRHAQPTAHTNIIYIMPIILAPRNRNQRCAQQRRKRQQHPRQIRPWAINATLSRNHQTQISEPAERKTAVAGGKTAPPVVQHVVIRLGAHGDCHECVRGCTRCGFAAREEVGARAPDGVFDDVGDEEGEQQAGEPAEECDVRFVGAGAGEQGPEDERGEGEGAGVDEEPCCGVLLDWWVGRVV
jgi:hypothetical protein